MLLWVRDEGSAFPVGAPIGGKRGRRLAKDVAVVDGLLGMGLRSPNAEAFVEDGHALEGELAEAVHARRDPGPAIEAESRDFMRRARERFITVRIGQAARRAGLNADEAANAMAAVGLTRSPTEREPTEPRGPIAWPAPLSEDAARLPSNRDAEQDHQDP